jgi:hypothetical protein
MVFIVVGALMRVVVMISGEYRLRLRDRSSTDRSLSTGTLGGKIVAHRLIKPLCFCTVSTL